MSSSFEKARTSAQGAYLADQVGKSFSQIFLLLAASFVILAIFTPTSLYFNPALMIDIAPDLCHGSIAIETKDKIVGLEGEIKSLELKLMTSSSSSSSSPSSQETLEHMYSRLHLVERIEREYIKQLGLQRFGGSLEGDITPVRPPLL